MSKNKAVKLMGKKRGMTHLFAEDGSVIAGTVIEFEPNIVVQVKTKEKDGYEAVQLGFEKMNLAEKLLQKRTKKPLRGHFSKNNIEFRRHLFEFRCETATDYSVGQQIDIDIFDDTSFVDVRGISIGKGFQGTMKLHNFSGNRASHGSEYHRSPGSIGMRSTPGRCLPNGKRASHMGNEWVTMQNLKVLSVDQEKGLMVVKGAIPGPRNRNVLVEVACKKK